MVLLKGCSAVVVAVSSGELGGVAMFMYSGEDVVIGLVYARLGKSLIVIERRGCDGVEV